MNRTAEYSAVSCVQQHPFTLCVSEARRALPIEQTDSLASGHRAVHEGRSKEGMDLFMRSRETITAGRTDETAGVLKAAATTDIPAMANSGANKKICICAAVQCFDDQTSENTQRM
jgi:hypothetical protein